MAIIQVLSDLLASQVAAGEVVERPASVVKELVENSLDARAATISVLARRGGSALLRVVDDGMGMDREDAVACLQRHATSKIRTSGDLAAIITKGFRGEALPSIASVSKFTLSTRQAGALTGTRVTVEGGTVTEVCDAGDAPGTQVEVRQLFYNMPARRKFLRSEDTEFSHIEQQVRVQALAHPEVGFRLTRDDRCLFHLPPGGQLLERIAGLAGAELTERLLEITDMERGPVRVSGFIGEAGLLRSTRSLQFTFLNRRPVESPVFTQALRGGYGEALPRGQSPVVFLRVEIDPAAVDVNVHPAKREVRFRHGLAVQGALTEILQETLRRGRAFRTTVSLAVPDRLPGSGDGADAGSTAGGRPPTPVSGGHHLGGSPGPSPSQEAFENGSRPLAGAELDPDLNRRSAPSGRPMTTPVPVPRWQPPAVQPALIPVEGEHVSPGGNGAGGASSAGPHPENAAAPCNGTAQGGVPAPPPPDASDAVAVEGKVPEFRVTSLLGGQYVVMESAEGLVLMDHRAAWERVLFEEALDRASRQGTGSQALLTPLTVPLSPREFDFLKPWMPALRRMGLGVEEFGPNTVMVDSLPPFWKSDGETPALLSALLDDLRHAGDRAPARRLDEESIAAAVARQAARRQAPQSVEQAEELVRRLLACGMPYCCPVGRPTIIQLSFQELARKFGRI
ncbi:MAG: mutl: dna mismatch repair protein mutl [Verrucomicrobiales bacterium]|nr:mutl: dna mismatch repair protein mutl [Verrucomicrobiales bacterium]